MKYEEPVLIDLSLETTKGACDPGVSDLGNCTNEGVAALLACSAGVSALNECTAGTAAILACTAGPVAVNACTAGGHH